MQKHKVLQRSPAPSASSSVVGSSARQRGTAPSRLLNESFDLQLDEASSQLSDVTDFSVIGILGMQGVGKSTIMSLLAGARWDEEGFMLSDAPFLPQSDESILHAVHQTSGIDLMVTGERILLLDTQPLLSASVLLELQRREASLPNEVQTHENLHELQTLRLAMLVLSSCHLVVCVQDESLVRCIPSLIA